MAQVTLNTRISPEISTALDAYAKATGKSKASLIEAALKNYLKEESPMSETKLNANLIIGAAGIPKGFKLCKEEIIKHPVDGGWGALLQNEKTGLYVHYAAGASRAIDQKIARKMVYVLHCDQVPCHAVNYSDQEECDTLGATDCESEAECLVPADTNMIITYVSNEDDFKEMGYYLKEGTPVKNVYDKDTFVEMIRDWRADNAPECDDLEVDEIEFDTDTQSWEAYAHDEKTNYSLTDDGRGNIVINYLSAR